MMGMPIGWSLLFTLLALISFGVVAFGFNHERWTQLRILGLGSMFFVLAQLATS